MCYQEMQDEVPDPVPTKDMLVAELMTVLNRQARNLGYACGVNHEGYRRVQRMTKVQLQNELDRLSGVKQLEDLPSDHVCIVVG